MGLVGQRLGRERQGQKKSLKIEVDGCPLFSASRKQMARAHSSGEARHHAAASATGETIVDPRSLVVQGTGSLDRTLANAAARGTCRRESVGTVRHVSKKVVWPQQLVKRGVVMPGVRTSAENRADLGTESHYLSTDCDS